MKRGRRSVCSGVKCPNETVPFGVRGQKAGERGWCDSRDAVWGREAEVVPPRERGPIGQTTFERASCLLFLSHRPEDPFGSCASFVGARKPSSSLLPLSRIRVETTRSPSPVSTISRPIRALGESSGLLRRRRVGTSGLRRGIRGSGCGSLVGLAVSARKTNHDVRVGLGGEEGKSCMRQLAWTLCHMS